LSQVFGADEEFVGAKYLRQLIQWNEVDGLAKSLAWASILVQGNVQEVDETSLTSSILYGMPPF
jgi:hypothetical protein